jgi:signal peptidase I
MDEAGTLRVNGTVQGGDILYPTYTKEGLEYPYRIPEGQVFIMGDYRTNTLDSRDYGSIPMEEVKGKIITILRRRGI